MLSQRVPEIGDGRGGNANSNNGTDSKVLQSVYNMDEGCLRMVHCKTVNSNKCTVDLYPDGQRFAKLDALTARCDKI